MGILDFLNKPIVGDEPKTLSKQPEIVIDDPVNPPKKTGVKKTIDVVIDEASALPAKTEPTKKVEVTVAKIAPASGKPLVAITWPIDEGLVQKIKEQADIRINNKPENLSPDELKTLVKGATAILCLLTNKIDAEIFESAGSQLKTVASMSMGFDHIDLEAAKARGVIVTNTPGTMDTAVAEHTVGLMLALAKSIPQANEYTRSGQYKGWDPTLFVGPELKGKTLGIVGLGRIGSSVAQIAKFGLGMKVIYSDVKANQEFGAKFSAKFRKLDNLLEQADFVTLHVPLLPSTKHLINSTNLKRMKHTAYLINTSRGPVVDEMALVKALKDNTIAGAALDVYEYEPTISPDLLKLNNVVLTPHIASATYEARQAMAEKAVANILAVLSGKSAPDALKS